MLFTSFFLASSTFLKKCSSKAFIFINLIYENTSMACLVLSSLSFNNWFYDLTIILPVIILNIIITNIIKHPIKKESPIIEYII